jgi:hypothetical protein
MTICIRCSQIPVSHASPSQVRLKNIYHAKMFCEWMWSYTHIKLGAAWPASRSCRFINAGYETSWHSTHCGFGGEERVIWHFREWNCFPPLVCSHWTLLLFRKPFTGCAYDVTPWTRSPSSNERTTGIYIRSLCSNNTHFWKFNSSFSRWRSSSHRNRLPVPVKARALTETAQLFSKRVVSVDWNRLAYEKYVKRWSILLLLVP